MQKKWILSGVAVLALLGMKTEVQATCSQAVFGGPTTATMDIGRAISGIVKSATALIGDGESKAQLIAEEEENNERAGSGGGGGGGKNAEEDATETKTDTPGASEFSGSAYSYIQSAILSKEGNIGYTPLKRAVASADAGAVRQNIHQAVVDNFFVDLTKEEQKKSDYQEKIKKQRQAYVEEATKRHITSAYKVKGFIQNDLASVPSAALSGGSELSSIAIDAHTLEQMVKMELVDLALQIEMMEADAIQFLMHQSPILMAETKSSATSLTTGTSADNASVSDPKTEETTPTETNEGGEQ